MRAVLGGAAPLMVLLGSASLLPVPCVAEHHSFDWVVQDWVVDFMRPTVALHPFAARRRTPVNVPDENRKGALMINGQYPGPTIEVNVNGTVSINVHNQMISEESDEYLKSLFASFIEPTYL